VKSRASCQKGISAKWLIYRRLNSFIWFDKGALFMFISSNATVSLCRAASALCLSGMTYILLLYVVGPNANVFICLSGMMLSKCILFLVLSVFLAYFL
jgi:hypothetical protein